MKHSNPSVGALVSLSLAIIGGAGCGGATSTVGSPAQADGVRPVDGAEVRVGRVRVAMREDPWARAGADFEHLTPVRVLIVNEGLEPIEVRYRSFEITSADGSRRFRALPPFHVHGEVEEPAFTTTVDHVGFAVAPRYADYYTAIATWDGDFRFDDLYYDEQVSGWREVGLPDAEILARALPEGVVRAGGHVEGYVYFRRPPPRMRDATFRADVIPVGGASIGTAAIAFDPR